MKRVRDCSGWSHGIGLWAVGVLLVVGACGDDTDERAEAPPDQSMVRDSAGIAITENSESGAAVEIWRVSDEPVLTIGADLRAPPEYQFERIDGVVRLPGRRLLVADGATLREFAEDGAFVKSWGQYGEGPGDFRHIEGLRKLGADSVVAWDRFPRRLTVFDTRGNLGRIVAIREAPLLHLVDVIGSDRFVFKRDVMQLEGNLNALLDNWDRREEYDRRSGFVEVWDATGNPVSIIGPHPDYEYFTRRHRDRYMGPVEFSRRMITGVWGSLVIAGPNDSYELRAHEPDGALARIVRLDRPPVVPGDAHRRTLLEADPERDPDIPMAATLPMFATVTDDELGYLWVRDYEMPGDDTVWWTVFDSEGAVAARLEVDERIGIREIGRDYIVASSRVGELGIRAVVVMSLDRG